jgi:hypothetical protein
MASVFGTMAVEAEAGFDYAVGIDLDAVPADEKDALLKKVTHHPACRNKPSRSRPGVVFFLFLRRARGHVTAGYHMGGRDVGRFVSVFHVGAV